MFSSATLGILRSLTPAKGPTRKLRAMLRVAQERHALKNLPPERLNDIGRTPTEAQDEANRAFWDVPTHWLR
ncbi:hypothetical protein [Amylibacter sp. IMCC11727]|uniref:DUF1127 domain-containing protein n=1 Tax=Amylibacter sp. IMCC11727 TaxID=3039851 RepID=UPI00244DCA86|nr:hypothetical protein [Amylibacter sp. IMCC11727]WGI23031.1 hypothetical protein QBD29_06315 [Amylibacter sp. IMCC11727]